VGARLYGSELADPRRNRVNAPHTHPPQRPSAPRRSPAPSPATDPGSPARAACAANSKAPSSSRPPCSSSLVFAGHREDDAVVNSSSAHRGALTGPPSPARSPQRGAASRRVARNLMLLGVPRAVSFPMLARRVKGPGVAVRGRLAADCRRQGGTEGGTERASMPLLTHQTDGGIRVCASRQAP
jgi:hypothetical protein